MTQLILYVNICGARYKIIMAIQIFYYSAAQNVGTILYKRSTIH